MTALAVVAVATGALATRAAASDDARAAEPVAPFSRNFFGMSMGADLTQLSDAAFDSEMNTMRKMGVHWVRAVVPWALVQPHGPDGQEWTLVDRLVETVQAEGMQLLAIVDNPPLWADDAAGPAAGCSVTPPFDLQAYADFTRLLAERYTSAAVPAIELENSPNLPGVWPKPDACDSAHLIKLAYTAIKGADPDTIVLNGGVGGTRTKNGSVAGDKWIDQLYQFGAGGSFDALSFHPYSYPCVPSDGCGTRTWGELTNVRVSMKAHGDGTKQIWATEFGAPTSGVAGDGHVSEAAQSTIMVDGMHQWATFKWGGPFFVYEYRDYGTDIGDKSDWFGLVSNNLKHKKPAFFAYQYYATGQGTPPAAARADARDGQPEYVISRSELLACAR